jgi:enoyl-CoA hydratase
MSDTPFRVERRERLAILRIDRPPVNALRFSDYASLARLLREVDAETLSCIVLTGAGTRAFIGGHDLNEFAAMTADELESLLPAAQELHRAIVENHTPIVAAINGAAIGNGLAVAALCDYRIAASTAVFSLPEIKRGVIGGAAAIARLVSDGAMRRFVLTGERVDASHALSIGLIDETCMPEEVMDRALLLAKQISANRPEALRLLRPSLPRLHQLPYMEAYALECKLSEELRRRIGDDASKDAARFIERRE